MKRALKATGTAIALLGLSLLVAASTALGYRLAGWTGAGCVAGAWWLFAGIVLAQIAEHVPDPLDLDRGSRP